MRFKNSSQRAAVMAKLRFINAPQFSANILPVQVSVIVPSTKRKISRISDEEFNKRVDSEKRWFDNPRRFGGDTSVQTVGSYRMGKKLVKEDGVKITASTTVDKYNKQLPAIEKHVMKRRKEWGQDTMFLEIEGHSFIVPKKGYIDSEKIKPKKILVT